MARTDSRKLDELSVELIQKHSFNCDFLTQALCIIVKRSLKIWNLSNDF